MPVRARKCTDGPCPTRIVFSRGPRGPMNLGNASHKGHQQPISPDSIAVAVALICVPLVAGLVSVRLGQDMNWDLLNYHYYNPYAFLTGRLDYDIAPAQEQTFFNPLPDVPFFLMTRFLPSRAIGFVLGLVHGVNLTFLFLAYRSLRGTYLQWKDILAATAVLVVSACAPGFLSELGNTMNDNLLGLLVLGPLLLLLSTSKQPAALSSRSSVPLALAGFLVGMGVGLKPTLAPFAIGMGVAAPMLYLPGRRRWLGPLVFGAAALGGCLASAGWWWWILWSKYSNPFLPFLNNVFRSPFIDPISFVPTNFFPSALWEYLVWPMVFSLDSTRVNPLKFTDFRFAILYVATVILLANALYAKLARPAEARPHHGKARLFAARRGSFVLAFFFLSFIIWMLQYSNYRFLIPLELLAPLCFLLLLDRLLMDKRALLGIAIVTALITLAAFKPFDWSRQPWSDPYLVVDTSPFAKSPTGMVIFLGGAPTSYVIPSLPQGLRAVRPQSNFVQPGPGLFYTGIRRLVRENRETTYVIFDARDESVRLQESMTDLQLNASLDRCTALRTNAPDRLLVCIYSPLPAPAPGNSAPGL